jgi:hypothetical protein
VTAVAYDKATDRHPADVTNITDMTDTAKMTSFDDIIELSRQFT